MKLKDYIAKKKEGEMVILPSGLEVRVKPVDTEIILREGNYPEELMEIIGKHVYGDGKTNDEFVNEILAGGAKQMRKTAQENRQWAEVIAMNTIISPKIVPENPDYDKDEIALSDLETPDLFWLGNLINMPLASVRPFCAKQNKAMERILNGEDDLPESEPVLEAEGDGSRDNAP